MCEGAEAESRRGPGWGFGVRMEDTSNPSWSLEVVHFRGLRAARPSVRGGGAAPGSVPSKMLASRLRENEGNPGGVSAAPGALRNAQVLGGIWGYGGGAWSPTRLRSVPLDRHLCPLNSTAARAPRSPGSFPRGLLLSGAGARGAAQSPGREAKGIPLP